MIQGKELGQPGLSARRQSRWGDKRSCRELRGRRERRACCPATSARSTTSRRASSRCGGRSASGVSSRCATGWCCTTRRWSSTSPAGSGPVCPRTSRSADLIQSGIFGLVDAIEKFEPERGLKFETYAMQRIRGAILDDLRAQDWVPRSVRGRAREVERALERLGAQLRRTPTDAELAEELGLSASASSATSTPSCSSPASSPSTSWPRPGAAPRRSPTSSRTRRRSTPSRCWSTRTTAASWPRRSRT